MSQRYLCPRRAVVIFKKKIITYKTTFTICIAFSLMSITDNFRSHNTHLRRELVTVCKISHIASQLQISDVTDVPSQNSDK